MLFCICISSCSLDLFLDITVVIAIVSGTFFPLYVRIVFYWHTVKWLVYFIVSSHLTKLLLVQHDFHLTLGVY